jgi:hypothetical protein
MNEEDKFEARFQEIHDDNTGATITLGRHAGMAGGTEGGEIRKGLRWLRIAVLHDKPGQTGRETKTSTITFGPDGQVLKILPHVEPLTGFHPTPGDGSAGVEGESPEAAKIKEELHHLDEVEASLHTDHAEHLEKEKVDKHARHVKK